MRRASLVGRAAILLLSLLNVSTVQDFPQAVPSSVMHAANATLERFVRAQDRDLAGFQTAIAELAAGAKRTHWIWYVFPQIAGLGDSFMSRQFAIEDAKEAAAYLQHDVLGPRLLVATQTVAGQLGRGVRLRKLMGVEIDVLKLVSSLTLFRNVAVREGHALAAEFAEVADQVLAAAAAEGYPACARTLRVFAEPRR